MSNLTRTTNGAAAYSTSGNALVDFNFSISTLRNEDGHDIFNKFRDIMDQEGGTIAMQYLLYIRDPRGGLGEKRIFREILKRIDFEYFKNIIDITAEFGSWKDIMVIAEDLVSDIAYKKNVDYILCVIACQYHEDLVTYNKLLMHPYKKISLISKYMPSPKCHSKKRMILAKKFMQYDGISERQYRKSLSKLRKYLDITEVKMSSNNWGDIDYEKVPSKANLNYANAFMRHDIERRNDYLNRLSNGEAKINASVLYPHEIYTKCNTNFPAEMQELCHENIALEEMWKALPDYTDGEETIVVVDSSGSMKRRVPGTKVECIDISRSLGIYFAEHNKGIFKDIMIEFSATPKLISISGCNSLYERKKLLEKYTDCSNTNIVSVMTLILDYARQYNVTKIPNVVIISDMQFDCICYGDTDTIFDQLKTTYKVFGYELPKICFWNVATNRISLPMLENDNGLILASGYSPAICKSIMGCKTISPYESILEQINVPKYIIGARKVIS